jgi:hypothetical protein
MQHHLLPLVEKQSKGFFSIIAKALVVFSRSNPNLFVYLGVDVYRPLLSLHYRLGLDSSILRYRASVNTANYKALSIYRIYMKIGIGMFASAAALALFLVAAWPENAANAQAYWRNGVGYHGASDYIETRQGWQWNGYGYGYHQAYSAGYHQGLSDAQAGLTYDCSGHTQYYCNGYSEGFNTYENNSQQQTQTQGTEINVNGNRNYVGINQEQTSGSGVGSSGYPAQEDDNNGNGSGYDSSIQPGQVNPSCKVICLTIVK